MKNTLLVLIGFFLLISGKSQTGIDENNPDPQVKNIILLIGDGMGTAQVYAGIIAARGNLRLEEFLTIGFSKTYSSDNFITDSGAAGTAIATGQKTVMESIGVDKNGTPVKSILHHAEDHGKLTGLIATSEITHATPASFIAHQPSRYLYEEIAADFLQTDIDVFFGGGRKYFEERKDGRNLSAELQSNGYQIVYSLDSLPPTSSGKVAGLLYEESPPRWSDGRGNMLSKCLTYSLENLQQGDKGFFLMVEGSQIDWGGHDNNTDYVLEELLDFDVAVGIALDFAKADGHTLVIVTADHETGGMSIMDGDPKTGSVTASYNTSNHSGEMVPVFCFGPGSQEFVGIYENTDLFYKMMKVFGF